MNNNDLRLIQRAVNNRWEIPEEVLNLLPVSLLEIITQKGETTRNKLAAIKALIAMNGQNISLDPPVQKSVTVNLSEDKIDELLAKELAEQSLGIGRPEVAGPDDADARAEDELAGLLAEEEAVRLTPPVC